ncbi:hypothetical protein [His 1 virus]|uniref:Uncharacterized protein ORF30 n=1 Tax=His1 virus (isolate Australia/Victoria) TaxID=654912 RepID=Y030_HIS1I|nr:hypothetical protein His1V_gp30 [His 1 virus]Q25BG5.1 RecName: Full=Uncharacterized protein ORF30 [His1 virus (isolate Victoria)]AAQ13753.1 hypothetical protein [His 1 virus]
MSDWRDFEPGRTGVSVANMADGESVEVQVVGEPYREDTSVSDNALHLPVVFLEAPDSFQDMSDDSVVTAEESDGEPKEYNIINSSTAFFNALVDAFPEAEQITGQSVEITARQPGDEYSRFYEMEV